MAHGNGELLKFDKSGNRGAALLEYELTVSRYAYFVRIGVSGTPSFEHLLSLIHVTGVESQAWSEHSVLVDLRRVRTILNRKQQVLVGLEAAGSLLHLRKIASVVTPEGRTRVSERAAHSCGANLKVFEDPYEAVVWLYDYTPRDA